MEFKIHRGLEQIGGCITEISTATSRVFIDLGQNLPGNGEEQTPEQDKLMVESLFKSNKKEKPNGGFEILNFKPPFLFSKKEYARYAKVAA